MSENDGENRLQIKQLKTFTPKSNRVSNGYSTSFFWYRFRITNATDSILNYFVKSTENFMHEMDCYIVSSNGAYDIYNEGVGYFIKNGKNKLKKPIVNVELKRGESKIIYIRMFSIFPSYTSFIVLDEKTLHSYVLKYSTFYAIYFGVICGLLFYNLFIYFFSREKVYVFYTLFVASFACWQLQLNGFFPFTHFSSTFSYYATGFFVPLGLAFLLFFARILLDTKKLLPALDKIIQYCGYVFFILVVGSIFFPHESYVIINILSSIMLPFLLYAGFKSYYKGNKAAIFFIVAQISFLSLGTLFSLMSDGYLEYNRITRHGVIFGSLIEIVLFSLALAYRIKLLQNEKLEIIHLSNIELSKEIDDRKKAEEELKASEEKYRLHFENVSDVIYSIDTDLKVQSVSPAVEKVLGYKPEEVIGKAFPDLNVLAPDYLEQAFLDTARVFNGERNISAEYEFICKDGTPRIGEVSGSPLIQDGKVIAVISVARDITKRKAIEADKEALENSLRQAQKIESIGTLAGGIAHDFNNILFPIVGLSEMLLEDLPPGSLEYENAQEILKAGKRGSDLIKQILAFSRQSEHKLMPVRIQQILKEVLKLSRSTIPSNIKITSDVQPDCGLVEADPTQIHQIAINLITNAYHAVQESDGEISMTLKETQIQSDVIRGDFLTSGNYAMLSISDTGCGINPDLMDKIFEPYFTTKVKGKGTGLGLAVVYGIVKEHKGDIEIYSEVGKGTTFNIYLPLMKKDLETRPVKKTVVSQTGNERVLLVDDDESIARLEKQMLKRLGYSVISYHSSIDALEAFKANPNAYDLVVTDMTMPNMTGDQLAKELIAIKSDIPVIVCTGFSERIDEERAKAIGVKGLIMKPVIKSEMAEMVRKVLDEAKNQ